MQQRKAESPSASTGSDSDAQPLRKRIRRQPAAVAPATSLPRPTFTLKQSRVTPSHSSSISIADLATILGGLSSLLATPALAATMHRNGIDSIARFVNLAHSVEETVIEAFTELEVEGVTSLQRMVLWRKLGELKADLAME